MQRTSLFAISITTMMGLCASAAWADTAEVVVRFKEKVSMESLARSVTDPASPRYQDFYSPEEIRALAAPSENEYNDVLTQFRAEGLEVVSESPSHLFVTVRGERATLEKMNAHAKANFAAMDFSPAARTIDNVSGLVPSQKRHTHLVISPMKGSPSTPSAQGNGVQPDQIHALYGFDAIYKEGFTGKGQHIAIATYDGFNISDVTQYYQKNNVTPGPTVDQVKFNGTPTVVMGSAAETETDAEFSGMIAPAAQIHVFTSAKNSDDGELAMFTAILDDNRAKVVNYSWGSCESQLSPAHKADMDKVFARAVAQGVNIMVASGDSGSSCQGNGKTEADYPAENPNVVAVGGTTLDTTGTEARETAWSGSGGGISTIYDLPDYQAHLGSAFAKRSYPDVAFNADPKSGQPTWIRYGQFFTPSKPSYVTIGGTSIAAPQWSGFLALVGEARGSKALGFLNPHVYSLSSANQAKLLRDVSSGNNGAYNAGAGFDAVTGFGSMRADALLNYLKNL